MRTGLLAAERVQLIHGDWARVKQPRAVMRPVAIIA